MQQCRPRALETVDCHLDSLRSVSFHVPRRNAVSQSSVLTDRLSAGVTSARTALQHSLYLTPLLAP